MNLVLLSAAIFVVLQFTDAITSIGLFSQSLDNATSLFKTVAGKFGIPATVITIKVVLVAIVVALYLLTNLPFWVYLLASVYYLYRTGRGAFLWGKVKAALESAGTTIGSEVKTVVTDVEKEVQSIVSKTKTDVQADVTAVTTDVTGVTGTSAPVQPVPVTNISDTPVAPAPAVDPQTGATGATA